MANYQKRNLLIPGPARIIYKKIELLLKELLSIKVSFPPHPDFISIYESFLAHFDQYREEVTRDYNKSVTCKKGCTYCCYHWVEDVYSFEVEIIADYIKKHLSEKIELIIDKFLEDEKHLINLNDIMEEKLSERKSEKEIEEIDTTDLLLSSFYQLKRPCAFLAEDRICNIYNVRPLTCRGYISFSDPQLCSPEFILQPNVSTYLLDLEESASESLDALHEMYNQFNKTGLRAVLIDSLS